MEKNPSRHPFCAWAARRRRKALRPSSGTGRSPHASPAGTAEGSGRELYGRLGRAPLREELPPYLRMELAASFGSLRGAFLHLGPVPSDAAGSAPAPPSPMTSPRRNRRHAIDQGTSKGLDISPSFYSTLSHKSALISGAIVRAKLPATFKDIHARSLITETCPSCSRAYHVGYDPKILCKGAGKLLPKRSPLWTGSTPHSWRSVGKAKKAGEPLRRNGFRPFKGPKSWFVSWKSPYILSARSFPLHQKGRKS